MVFPAIEYWRSYKIEKRVGPQGEKADYNFFFYMLVAGVAGMWATWIYGTIVLFTPGEKAVTVGYLYFPT